MDAEINLKQEVIDAPRSVQHFQQSFTSDSQNRVSCKAYFNKTQGRGSLGNFDSSPEATTDDYVSCIARALGWLKSLPTKEIYGPIDGSTWYPYRVFEEASSKTNPRFGWEPKSNDHLKEALLRIGFSKDKKFSTTGFEAKDHSPALRILKGNYERALKEGFTFENFSGASDLPEIYKLSMECFPENYLFDPIDYREFARLYESSISSKDFSASKFIVSPQGVPVGFLYAFLDQDYVVIKSIAVAKSSNGSNRLRKWSPSGALLYLVLKYGAENNTKGAISALVIEGGSTKTLERYQRWAQCWQNHYYIYKLEV